MKRLLAVLLLAVLACAPAFAERRWFVQDSRQQDRRCDRR